MGCLKDESFKHMCKVSKKAGREEKRRHAKAVFIQETLLQPLKHGFDVLLIHILMHIKMNT